MNKRLKKKYRFLINVIKYMNIGATASKINKKIIVDGIENNYIEFDDIELIFHVKDNDCCLSNLKKHYIKNKHCYADVFDNVDNYTNSLYVIMGFEKKRQQKFRIPRKNA